MTDAQLLEAIHTLYDNREKYVTAMTHQTHKDSVSMITELIDRIAFGDKSA